MNAYKNNIYTYLGGTRQYQVPMYQRTYSWKHEQCARLWDDIVDLHRTGREGHFIGSIVRIEEPSKAGYQLAMIIDGQQRLTTLTLLLIALRDYASSKSDCGVNPDQITDTLLLNKYEAGNKKYRLLLTQSDRDSLIKIVEGAVDSNSPKSRVLGNYFFFKEKIENLEINPIDLYESIGKLQIVDIALDRQYDEPQAIFESLNSTGVDLKDSDLIRNYLLMGLNIPEQEEIYNNIWRPTEVLFDYDHQSELLDNFFRDYLTMKLGRIANKNKVYKEFVVYHKSSGLKIHDLCQDIRKFAEYYTNMCFEKSEDSVLKSLYGEINAIRMEVVYPFLLKAHNDCDKKIITIEELRKIIRLCVSYVLRRAVCDLPSNSLNKIFAAMNNAIRPDDYLNSVKAFFILMDSNKEFPNDSKFIETFLTRDIYNMNRCLYILKKLENWDNRAVVSLEDLTIEHILPQNPTRSSDWVRALDDNLKKVQEKYLHTIGNLTLTAYNSEMSNSSFSEKLSVKGGLRQSALRLNSYVVEQADWGESQIKERAKQLSEIAKKVWPYPTLTEAELEPYRKQEKTVTEYTLEYYKWNDVNRELFNKLDVRILNLDICVKREYKKNYIAYKMDTNFVDVEILKKKLRLTINMKFDEVYDPNGICQNASNIKTQGNGDVGLYLESLHQLDDVMEIIKQSYRLQAEE